MFDKDPRLQLYPATSAKLQQLFTECAPFFSENPQDTFEFTDPWTGYYAISRESEQDLAFNFTDLDSKFPAKVVTLTRLQEHEDIPGMLSIGLAPYPPVGVSKAHKYYEVLLTQDGPPVLANDVTAGESVRTTDELRTAYTHGLVEKLSAKRAGSLLHAIGLVTIREIDLRYSW